MKRLTFLFSITAITLLISCLITSSASAYNIVVRARGDGGAEKIRLTINTSVVKTWTLTTSFADYNASTTLVGDCFVKYYNDGNTAATDAQVDYITVDGLITRQAEGQAVNTGVFQNGQCGGSYSEWMNCNGYINFGYTESYYNLFVSPTSLSLSGEADSTGTFDVNSNTDWTVSSNQTWLTVDPASGSNDGTVTVTAQENTTLSPRTATVTVSGTSVTSKTVTVTQNPVFAVSPTELTVGAAGNSSSTFNITTSRSWTVSSDQTWLTVDPASGSNNATVTVTAQQNNTGIVRIAVVTVSATGVAPQTVTVAQSGTIDASYEIGTWSGFRAAAISYTFDDGYMPNFYSIAIPMFDSYDYKLTSYPVINWGPNWTALQAAAAEGHEVGNHTMTHPSLGGMPIAQQVAEELNSKNAVDANIPGNQCLTIAYPNCSVADQATTATYFIAARTCASGTPNPATPSNFYTIQSVFLGDQGLNTLAAITAYDDAAAAAGGWGVFCAHAIDNDSGYSPISSTLLEQSVQYLDANRDMFWVNTFLNVAKYIKERNSVSVSETSSTADSITVSVTDTLLNNTIYNYPITIRRPVPAGWGSAIVTQDGNQVNSSIVMVDSMPYVMFDVVPDGGDVVLSKGAYGDLNGNGIVAMNDLDIFVDYWLVEDCDFSSWLDLDEDCMVTFYEFAALAANWQGL